MDSVFLTLVIFNCFSALIFGIDKFFAIKNKRRISEKILILLASAFPFGVIIGMVLFNHKTSKIKFRLFVPFSCLLHFSLQYYVFYNNLL